MTPTTDKTTASFVEALVQQSDADAGTTPMDAVAETARTGKLTDDQCYRLLAPLWTLKRMMYYIYGAWAQGIHLNEYPPAVAYLFGRQTYDESTYEMQLCDEILKRRWVRTQRHLFNHPYGQFDVATRTGAYIFCSRALANYPQNIRIAATLSVIDDFLVGHPLHGQSAEQLMHFMEGKYQIDADALTPEDQRPIEPVFDFLLRSWASEPSRSLGGAN
jgi:hypothetical protein